LLNLIQTVGGLALACIGIGLTWGVGYALLVFGTVCFVAGAADAALRKPRHK